ncbi:MAG: response regulator [Pirellulales bacterium]|nr:response regulator [Pirellulales bacterium]
MSKCILLCDDEVHILRASEFKFRRAGYDVICASDGQDAWEKIQERCPDILVSDCQMPRMDGFQLIEKLRDNEATRDLPVMMLTAKGFESGHLETAERLGVATVLPKPFSPRQLLETVERMLAGEPVA